MHEQQQPGFNILIDETGIQLDQIEEIIKDQNGFVADIEAIRNGDSLDVLLIFDTMRNAQIFERRMSNANIPHNTAKLINTNIHKGLPATKNDMRESSLHFGR